MSYLQQNIPSKGKHEVSFLFSSFLPPRCSSNKVYLMSASSLINISYGDRCEAKKIEEKSGARGRQQQTGTSKTQGVTPFSPSLGASPELTGKNKAGKHRAADLRQESSGKQ